MTTANKDIFERNTDTIAGIAILADTAIFGAAQYLFVSQPYLPYLVIGFIITIVTCGFGYFEAQEDTRSFYRPLAMLAAVQTMFLLATIADLFVKSGLL